MSSHIAIDIIPRAHKVGVRTVVWGWNEADLQQHRPLLEQVETMVVNGYEYGQPEEDIEEDILIRFLGIVFNVEVEITDQGASTGLGQIELRLEAFTALDVLQA
jgi:hypothetical protein